MRSRVSGVGHMHDLMDSLFEHALKFHKKMDAMLEKYRNFRGHQPKP